jgi:chloride channel 3/4/5
LYRYTLLSKVIDVGVSVGILAAAIDIVSDWLGDLKEGFCKPTFYLNRGFCCWGISGTPPWKYWTDKVRTGVVCRVVYLGYCIKCIVKSRGICCLIHLLHLAGCTTYFDTGLIQIVFGGAASLLVVSYAPYAKHSGIPEIKTMLGGFVIRRFIGTWVLLIKSLGLVLPPSDVVNDSVLL